MAITREHTCGNPEVDYKSQNDHCERREVEPVWPVVLERTQDKSEEKKLLVNARRGKALLMRIRHNLAVNQRSGAYQRADRRSRWRASSD